MAKGYDKDRERKSKVSLMGRELARRAKSRCEMCEATGVKLEVFEVPPVAEEPNIERCIFICESCKKVLSDIDRVGENDVRFFNNTIWSEVDMVKAVSIAALKKLETEHPWASDILEGAYIDEEMKETVEEIEL